jgi:hypothetical protein
VSPFLQFRLWLRRSPASERLATGTVAVALLALLVWALVPFSASSPGPGGALMTPTTPKLGGAASVASGSAGAAGGAPTDQAPGAPAANPSATATTVPFAPLDGLLAVSPGVAPPAGGCGSLGATDQGVSATDIRIDVDVADLAGQAGNSLVGIPSAQEEEAMFAAAIDAINRSGGLRCRRVVAKYYSVNPLDQSSLEAACLQMVGDHPFALLDEGLGSPAGSPTPRDCPPSHKVPEFGTLNLSQAEINQFSPYLFGDGETAESVVHDWVLAAHQLGWFAGKPKIGLLEQDCVPGINHLVLSDLAGIGFPASQITKFDFGCPNQIPPPTEVEQAVLEFKAAGVTHVMDDGGIYENYFSKDASGQGFHPKYSVGDQGTIALWDNPTFGPEPGNFGGALAITSTQYGAENTPGAVLSPPTSACDKAMAAKRLPPAERSPDAFSGVACALTATFATAVERAPTLTRINLAAGLALAGHLVFPFPVGPGNFAASQGLHGGGYWRADTYVASCSCFRVSVPTFTPSFP